MAGEQAQTPLHWSRTTLRSVWRNLLTIYWANSTSWRVLKAGALLFFGFFLWASSNVLLSVQPGWTILHYAMAYGFVLIIYGPIHHLVVIPLALKWRRTSGPRQRLGKRLPNTMLVIFLAVVVVLGTFPAGPMTVDLSSTLEDAGADINPDLVCVKSTNETGTSIHCHLSESEGIDRVEVQSGGDTVLVDKDPPFEFTVEKNELSKVRDRTEFTVELLDEDGTLLRRYTRYVDFIRSG